MYDMYNLKSINNIKSNLFIKILKKNEIFFIAEEYVIFYELDNMNILNDKRDLEHKSKRWSKYFDKFIEDFFLFLYILNNKNISKRLIIQNHVLYVFYYMYKFNRKYTIKKNFFKSFYYNNIITFNY